jgi:hypothetical protein
MRRVRWFFDSKRTSRNSELKRVKLAAPGGVRTLVFTLGFVCVAGIFWQLIK